MLSPRIKNNGSQVLFSRFSRGMRIVRVSLPMILRLLSSHLLYAKSSMGEASSNQAVIDVANFVAALVVRTM